MNSDWRKLAMTRVLCAIGLITIAVGYNDMATVATGSLIFLAGLVERLAIAIIHQK